VSVAAFEFAMTTDYINFKNIQTKVPASSLSLASTLSRAHSEIIAKSLPDVIHFYWFWKTTVHYKEWKKVVTATTDRSNMDTLNYRPDYAEALREEASSVNARLRKKPRCVLLLDSFLFSEIDFVLFLLLCLI
jgi:hypothetical protein